MGRGILRLLGAALVVPGVVGALLSATATAGTPRAPAPAPVISSLDVTAGITAGGALITVVGDNFEHVKAVTFAGVQGTALHVRSATVLIITAPPHRAGTVSVQVITKTGRSAATKAARFRYEPLSFTGTHLNGGMTAPQEIALGNKLRAAHRGIQAALVTVPRTVASTAVWAPRLGAAAVARAKAWLGMPYSWDGGSDSGPSVGECDYGHGGGGWFDCEVAGFDCSGLTLFAWAPYRSLAHYAATQLTQAGSFHPTLDELQPGDLLFYSTNGTIAGVHHVVMYAGKGTVIQAFQSGFSVEISPLSAVLPTQFVVATRPLSRGKQGAAPSITRLSLSTVTPRGGQLLTITGHNLSTASDVKFGSSRVYQLHVVSSSTIQVRVPAHATGAVRVQVGNAWGISPSSAKLTLRYANPTPSTPPPMTPPPMTPPPTTSATSTTPSEPAPTATVGS